MQTLALAILGAAATAQAQQSLTLEEAVQHAVRHNAGLRASAAGVEVANAQADMARARLLPRIDVFASFVRTDHPVLAFGTRLAQERIAAEDLSPGALNSPDSIDDWVARVEARVPLVDVSAWYALAASTHGREMAEASTRAAEAQVVADTVAAYYGVQLASAALTVAHEVLHAAGADLTRTEASQQAGMAMAADVAGLKAEVASRREHVIKAEGALAVARARLARIVGVAVNSRFELTTPLQPSAEAPPQPTADTGLSPNHPELERSHAALEAARAQQTSALAAYAPTLNLMGGLEQHSNEFVLGEGGTNYKVGVELRLNLFAGGADAARSDQAAAEVARVAATADDARSELELHLLQARRAVLDADAVVQVTADALAHARESHRLQRARSEAGMAQTADVMRARASLLYSAQRHLEAVYDRRIAAVALAAASGTLDRSFPGANPGASP